MVTPSGLWRRDNANGLFLKFRQKFIEALSFERDCSETATFKILHVLKNKSKLIQPFWIYEEFVWIEREVDSRKITSRKLGRFIPGAFVLPVVSFFIPTELV